MPCTRADWAAATASAELNWLTDLLCLVACCFAVANASTSLVVLLAAYLAGMTASSVSMLPGGFGVIEVAMIFALTGGGMPLSVATPAVLLYRLISSVLVVGTGWVAWLVALAASRISGRNSLPLKLGWSLGLATSMLAPIDPAAARVARTAFRPRATAERAAAPAPPVSAGPYPATSRGKLRGAAA